MVAITITSTKNTVNLLAGHLATVVSKSKKVNTISTEASLLSVRLNYLAYFSVVLEVKICEVPNKILPK